jgi:hypothetical protein
MPPCCPAAWQSVLSTLAEVTAASSEPCARLISEGLARGRGPRALLPPQTRRSAIALHSPADYPRAADTQIVLLDSFRGGPTFWYLLRALGTRLRASSTALRDATRTQTSPDSVRLNVAHATQPHAAFPGATAHFPGPSLHHNPLPAQALAENEGRTQCSPSRILVVGLGAVGDQGRDSPTTFVVASALASVGGRCRPCGEGRPGNSVAACTAWLLSGVQVPVALWTCR